MEETDDYGMVAGKDESEACLPKATVAKIIKELLPKDIRVAKDSQDLIIEAAMEFLQMLSSQANDNCTKAGRQQMTETHVLEALKDLNFEHYIEEVQVVNQKHKVEAAGRKSKSSKKKLKDSGMTEEELIKAQEALFSRSRQTYQESLKPTPCEQAAQPAPVETATEAVDLKTESGPASEEAAAVTGLGLAAPTLVGMEDEDDDYDDM